MPPPSSRAALVDNRSAELSEWDLGELAAQLAEMHGDDPALAGALGWDDAQLGVLLAAEWQAPALEPLPGAEAMAPLVRIAVTADQHAVIARAVARVREREGDAAITDGRALELVAADFLAGP
jgi:hypothetical protein